MRSLALVVLAALFAGCASVHPGPVGQSIGKRPRWEKAPLIVSALENDDLSSRYFGVVTFTFENKTDEWIYVDEVQLDAERPPNTPYVTLPWGIELARWHEATAAKMAMTAHNTAVFLGALQVLGAGTAVVGAAARDRGVVAAGSAVVLGAAAAGAIKETVTERDAIEAGPIDPRSHLLAPGFAVPPGMFLRRWVVVNTREHQATGYIKNLVLHYTTRDGLKDDVRLPFRAWNCSSEWQRDVCRSEVRRRYQQ